jgi:hypothetical protein
MSPACDAMTPAAAKAFCELWRKTTVVVESSEKAAGIRAARTRRNKPKPKARKIPIMKKVRDKPDRWMNWQDTVRVSHSSGL